MIFIAFTSLKFRRAAVKGSKIIALYHAFSESATVFCAGKDVLIACSDGFSRMFGKSNWTIPAARL